MYLADSLKQSNEKRINGCPHLVEMTRSDGRPGIDICVGIGSADLSVCKHEQRYKGSNGNKYGLIAGEAWFSHDSER